MANGGQRSLGLSNDVLGEDEICLIQRIRAVPTILRIVCDTTGLGFAAIGRVTDESWIACAVLDRAGFGLMPGWRADIATTFCLDVCASCAPLFIEHASEDPRYRDHATPKLYGFQSYASAPIILSDNSVWGTICTFDPAPAKLDQISALATLEMFAKLVSSQIEAQVGWDDSRLALQNAKEMGELREHFIAVLGHDIRSPLAALLSGIEILSCLHQDEKTSTILTEMRRSGMRISDLVDATLDLARGRLGGGIPIARVVCPSLAADLGHVVSELRAAHPGRHISFSTRIDAPVSCDIRRLSQMLSNLVSNALRHGAVNGSVRVIAYSDKQSFLLSVTNDGKPIQAGKIDRLFEPYTRMSDQEVPEGLGLGLFICKEIAKAHGGTMKVDSTDEATTFTFSMPQGEPSTC